jgi:hypothetical protein
MTGSIVNLIHELTLGVVQAKGENDRRLLSM